MSKNEVFIAHEIIIEKARRTQFQINATLLEEEQTQLKFSHGWLSKTKIGNCFKRYRSHGKSGDADHDAILNELPKLQPLFSASHLAVPSTPMNSASIISLRPQVLMNNYGCLVVKRKIATHLSGLWECI